MDSPTSNSDKSDVLDFTHEKPVGGDADARAEVPYDPRPHEDGARRVIALLLIGLLWLIVAAILIMVAWGSVSVDELKDFSVILGPVVTLVSAATGFYYGTKSNGK